MRLGAAKKPHLEDTECPL